MPVLCFVWRVPNMRKKNAKYTLALCVAFMSMSVFGCMPDVNDVFKFEEEPEPEHPTQPTDPEDPQDPGGESQRPGGSGGVIPGPEPGFPEDPGSQGGGGGGAVVTPEVLGVELVSPASGDVRGGYEVRVHGTALEPGGIAQFGSIRAPSQTYVNSNVVRAVVPPGKIGCVDLVWTQGEERLSLKDAFCYTENVGVKAVSPDVVVAGELSEITLSGNGFDAHTSVYFSDGSGSIGMTDLSLASETRMVGNIVLETPGETTLYVANGSSHAVVEDVIRVLPRLEPAYAEPAAIQVGKRPKVKLVGSGFSEDVRLRIGQAVIAPEFVSAETVTFDAPELPAGSYDILVYDDHRQYRLEQALHYYAAGTGQRLFSVSPDLGSVKGGNEVRISGIGMSDRMNISFGASRAQVKSCTETACLVTAPPGTAGRVDVSSGEMTLKDVYEYIVVPEVASVEPAHGAAGSVVSLAGSGFGDALRVFFGGHEASQVRVVSEGLAEVEVPAGNGEVPIRVVQGRADKRSDVMFSYDSPVAVTGVSPDQSVILGGTVMHVFGSGFSSGMTLWLDGEQITDVTVDAANTMTFVAPAHDKGEAKLEIRGADGNVCAETEIAYFDPTGINTSASGGVISGQLHVTVLTVDTAVPIEHATVYVGGSLDTAVTGTTDANGRVSFFLDDLQGAQIVTACAPEHSCNTLQPINASVITLFLEDWHANDASDSEDPPPPPPPSDGDMINPIDVTIEYTPKPAYFRGTVGSFGKEELISDPNLVKAGVVMQSTLSPYAPYYQQDDVYLLMEEGAEYKVQARKGDVALALVCGFYNKVTGELLPRYIGVKRHQFVYDGVDIVNHLECPIPLNQTQSVKLLDPPLHSGPNVVSGSAYLDFGDEGYIGGFMSGQSKTDLVVITNMPPLRDTIADAHFAYSVGAYTNMGYPATVFYEYDTLPSETPLEVGPAAPIPVFITKPYDDVLAQGVISWTIEHPQNVDFYSLVMRDYRSSGMVLVNQAYLPGTATSFEFPKGVYHWAEDHSSRLYISLTAYKSVREGFDFNRFSTGDTRYNYIHSSANSTLMVYDPETAALYYPH